MKINKTKTHLITLFASVPRGAFTLDAARVREDAALAAGRRARVLLAEVAVLAERARPAW